MRQLKIILCSLLYMVSTLVLAAEGANDAIRKVKVDLTDRAALQRGARMYMNYCSGCHSLEYLRYSRLAQDLGITDNFGQIDQTLLKNNLIFTTAKTLEPIKIAMLPEESREWFGIEPPDLSLSGRVHGADWLFTYLTSFYADPKQPFGVNNWLYPDVAMPNILINLQGKQVPVYRQKKRMNGDQETTVEVISDLQIVQSGSMNKHEFDSAVRDLVSFLMYVAEPNQLQRQSIGKWVLLFLFVLLVLSYCLKKDYWKDIKSRKSS